MKKFIALIIACLLIASPALAFRNSGEFYGDRVNNVERYSSDFAPNSGTVVSLGTKGVSTLLLETLAKYKFFFTKVADDTADICKVWFKTVTTHDATGAVRTSGDGPWHPGEGLSSVTFGCASSATTHYLTIYKQVKP